MPQRIDVALLVAVLSGCAQPTEIFIDREDAKSLIIAKESGGEWKLEAGSLADGRTTELASPDPIYLLFYQRSLAQLQLLPGPLSQEPPWRPLPQPDRGFLVDESGPVALDELPEQLGGVQITRQNPCYEFVIAEQGFVDGASALFFTAAIDDRVLLSTDVGFFWADSQAIVPATDLPADLPREAGFWHEASRELWLIDGATGRVMHGAPSSGFASAPDLPNVDRTPIYLDGSRGDAPFELFVVTSSRALYRFDGDRWEERAPARGLGPHTSKYQVAWSAAGRAVALSDLGDRVIEDDGSRVHDVFVPELDIGASDDAVRAARFVEGYGPLLATERGALYSRNSVGWQVLHRAESRTEAFIIEPLGVDGVLYGGEDGVLAQYHPGVDCSSFGLSPRGDASIIAWLSPGEQPIALYPVDGAILWVRARASIR